MKIIHIINSLAVGGSERYLLRFLSYTNSSKQDQHIVIYFEPQAALRSEFEKIGIKVIDFSLNSKREQLNILNQLAPDILHCWLYKACLHGFIYKRLISSKPKIIWSFRNALYLYRDYSLLKKLQLRILAKLSKSVNCILFNSEVSACQHVELGFKAEYKVIPNGFEIDNLHHKGEVLSNGSSSQKKQKTVLTLARSHHEKGYDILLKAIKLFVQSKPNEKVTFILAGTNVENIFSTYPDINLTDEVKGTVYLLPQQEDVVPLLEQANILICPSRTEAFPNVVGEAMSMAVPVIGSDVGDTAKMIADTGYLVPAEDSAAIANALENFFDLSISDQEKLGQRAFNRIKNNFEINIMLDKQYEIYSKILNNDKLH